MYWPSENHSIDKYSNMIRINNRIQHRLYKDSLTTLTIARIASDRVAKLCSSSSVPWRSKSSLKGSGILDGGSRGQQEDWSESGPSEIVVDRLDSFFFWRFRMDSVELSKLLSPIDEHSIEEMLCLWCSTGRPSNTAPRRPAELSIDGRLRGETFRSLDVVINLRTEARIAIIQNMISIIQNMISIIRNMISIIAHLDPSLGRHASTSSTFCFVVEVAA